MVYALLVTLKFTSTAALEEVREKLKILAFYSNTKEPDTLTYEIHQPEEQQQDAPTLLIIERYTNKAALTEIHEKSSAFIDFRTWVEGTTGLIADVKKEFFEQDEVLKAVCDIRNTASDANGTLVFCGSRPGTNPLFIEKAAELGKLLAERNRTLVYGGGTVGVMGALANAVIEANGNVIGVIPTALRPKEMSGDMIGRVVFCDTMSGRKSIMFSQASTVISLPGGIGTFDELLEVMTLFQLNAYRPKIGILNVGGCYDPFFAMLEQMKKDGFLNADATDYYVVASEPTELLDKLDAFTPPKSSVNLSWPTKP